MRLPTSFLLSLLHAFTCCNATPQRYDLPSQSGGAGHHIVTTYSSRLEAIISCNSTSDQIYIAMMPTRQWVAWKDLSVVTPLCGMPMQRFPAWQVPYAVLTPGRPYDEPQTAFILNCGSQAGTLTVDLRLVSPHEADILRAKVALMLLDVFVALAWLRKLWSDWRSAVTPVIGVALLSRFLVHGGVMSALGDAWLDVVFIVALFWLLDFMTDGQKRRAGWVTGVLLSGVYLSAAVSSTTNGCDAASPPEVCSSISLIGFLMQGCMLVFIVVRQHFQLSHLQSVFKGAWSPEVPTAYQQYKSCAWLRWVVLAYIFATPAILVFAAGLVGDEGAWIQRFLAEVLTMATLAALAYAYYPGSQPQLPIKAALDELAATSQPVSVKT